MRDRSQSEARERVWLSSTISFCSLTLLYSLTRFVLYLAPIPLPLRDCSKHDLRFGVAVDARKGKHSILLAIDAPLGQLLSSGQQGTS